MVINIMGTHYFCSQACLPSAHEVLSEAYT